MHLRVKTGLLVIIAVLSIAAYLFVNIGSNWSYALARRGGEILAIVLTGGAIGYSTLVFQTITNNRILTPSIIGLDSLYLLIQTVVIFFFGSSTLAVMDSQFNFVVSVGLMILFAGVLYKVLFKREGQNIYFLLLTECLPALTMSTGNCSSSRRWLCWSSLATAPDFLNF
jgi:iron complex transport system permease protein